MSNGENQVIKVVCIGRYRAKGGGLAVGFRRLDTAEDLGFDLSKNTRRFQPGAEYEVAQVGATTYRLGGAKYLGMHEDRGAVAAWRAQSDAEEALHRAARLEKQEVSVDALAELLLPVRRAYSGAFLQRDLRLAIELRVLEALRRPVG